MGPWLLNQKDRLVVLSRVMPGQFQVDYGRKSEAVAATFGKDYVITEVANALSGDGKEDLAGLRISDDNRPTYRICYSRIHRSRD